MITDAQLSELKALEREATPGPWTSSLYTPDALTSYIPEIWHHDNDEPEGIYSPDDAAFIAAARNLMPDLLAEVERLTRLVGYWSALAARLSEDDA